jgi:hypothetical protein
MDLNAYSVFTKYHSKVEKDSTNDLTTYLGSENRRLLVIWLINLSQSFPFIEQYLDRNILLFDKLTHLPTFKPAYQKIILLSILQLSLKLDFSNTKCKTKHFKNLLEYSKKNVSSSLNKSVLNMSEIFVCNQLDWSFNFPAISQIIEEYFNQMNNKIFKIIDKQDLFDISKKIIKFSLIIYSTAEVKFLNNLALAIILLTIDQFALSESLRLILTKAVIKFINTTLEKNEIYLNNVKWLKDTLYDYIISTQEYPIVMRYSDEILNEYKDNLNGNHSCIIGKGSYVRLFNEYDLLEPSTIRKNSSASCSEENFINNYCLSDLD